jgi:O-antigen ligase
MLLLSGYLCVLLYVAALASLGSSKFYGVFYAASVLASVPFLGLVLRARFPISTPTKIYLVVVVSFQILYFFHVLVMGSPFTELDNISRIAFGAVNGAFFFIFLNYRRQSLFLFLILLAFLHASVAILTLFYQAWNFDPLGPSDWRFGGVTNSIAFSEMLLASVGLVAIYWSGKIHGKQGLRNALILTLFLCLGLFALVLTGSRGTLLALLPLALLMAANARFRGGQLFLLGAIVVLGALAISFSGPLQGRLLLLFADLRQFGSGTINADALSVSVGLREKMWRVALELAAHRPLFGYGVGSFPAMLRDPSLGIPLDSSIMVFNNVHNQYLDLLLETGVLGLTLFCLLLGTALVTGFRLYSDPRYRDRACALMWISSCYACFGLSQTFFGHANTSLQFGAYLGILMWTIPAHVGQRSTAP